MQVEVARALTRQLADRSRIPVIISIFVLFLFICAHSRYLWLMRKFYGVLEILLDLNFPFEIHRLRSQI